MNETSDWTDWSADQRDPIIDDLMSGRASHITALTVSARSGVIEVFSDIQRVRYTQPGDSTRGQSFEDEAWHDASSASMCIAVARYA